MAVILGEETIFAIIKLSFYKENMNIIKLEQSVIELLDFAGVDYNDLTPYQKGALLNNMEYAIEDSDILDESKDQSYDNGYKVGKADGEYEANQDIEERLDKAFADGRSEGYEDGYEKGYDEGVAEALAR